MYNANSQCINKQDRTISRVVIGFVYSPLVILSFIGMVISL